MKLQNYTHTHTHVRWVPCHHSMAHLQVVDGGEGGLLE